jgi:hypothetical protein
MLAINEPKNLTDFWKIVSYPTKAITYGATRANLAFLVSNALRDAITYQAFSSELKGIEKIPVVGGVFAWFEGMVKQHMGNQYAIAFRDWGGSGAGYFAQTRYKPTRRIKRLYGIQEPHTMSPVQAMKAIKHGLDKYEQFVSTGDVALRVQEFEKVYKKAIEDGEPEKKAMLEALEAGREITTNFARGTELSRQVSTLRPYFNASVQSNRKLIRALMGKNGPHVQRQVVYNGLKAITAMSALQYLLHGDEDWFLDLEEWARLNYWHFKIPTTDQVVRIPKPFEFGKLMSNPFEYLADTVSNKNPVAAKSIVWDFMMQLVGGGAFVPSIMLGPVEWWANKSLYTGHEIVPWFMQQSRIPEDQYTAYTTWTAKITAKALGGVGLHLSPAKLDQFVRSMTGGLGLKLMRITDLMASTVGLAEDPVLGGEARLEDIPGIGTLFRHEEFEHGRAVRELVETSNLLSQKAGSEVISPDERAARPVISRAMENVSTLRKALREGRLTRDEMNARISKVAREALDTYRKIVR